MGGDEKGRLKYPGADDEDGQDRDRVGHAEGAPRSSVRIRNDARRPGIRARRRGHDAHVLLIARRTSLLDGAPADRAPTFGAAGDRVRVPSPYANVKSR